jgi:hypothetical protein
MAPSQKGLKRRVATPPGLFPLTDEQLGHLQGRWKAEAFGLLTVSESNVEYDDKMIGVPKLFRTHDGTLALGEWRAVMEAPPIKRLCWRLSGEQDILWSRLGGTDKKPTAVSAPRVAAKSRTATQADVPRRTTRLKRPSPDVEIEAAIETRIPTTSSIDPMNNVLMEVIEDSTDDEQPEMIDEECLPTDLRWFLQTADIDGKRTCASCCCVLEPASRYLSSEGQSTTLQCCCCRKDATALAGGFQEMLVCTDEPATLLAHLASGYQRGPLQDACSYMVCATCSKLPHSERPLRTYQGKGQSNLEQIIFPPTRCMF